MRLVFLGTGGPGNPHIGAARGMVTLASRGTNAIVVQPDYPAPPTLLLDAGPDIRTLWAMWQEAPPHPDAVLLSHGHFDHIGGMSEFRRLDAKLPVYGTASTLADLTRFGAVVNEADPSINFDPHELPERGAAEVCGVAVETVPLYHGSAPCTGFILRHDGRTVAYLADTEPRVEPDVCSAVSGCDVLIVNTPFISDVPIPGIHPSLADAHERHISALQAVALAQAVGAKRLVLTHFMHPTTEHDLRELAAAHPWVITPVDGQTLDL